jgi:hypothetical protein
MASFRTASRALSAPPMQAQRVSDTSFTSPLSQVAREVAAWPLTSPTASQSPSAPPATSTSPTLIHPPPPPLPRVVVGADGIVHQEGILVISSASIPQYAVEVTYTNDVFAVNRWILTHLPPWDGKSPAPPPPAPDATGPPPPNSGFRFVGLDVEWIANRATGEDNRLAVVQIATERAALVFHAGVARVPTPDSASPETLLCALANDRLLLEATPDELPLPIELARLFADPTVLFVGVGAKSDILKVLKDFGLNRLSAERMERGREKQKEKEKDIPDDKPASASTPSSSGPQPASSGQPVSWRVPIGRESAGTRVVDMDARYFGEKRVTELTEGAINGGGMGLKKLGTTVLGVSPWGKKQHMLMRWDIPLSYVQIRYAAMDAFASKVVFEIIEAHVRRMPEEEELERRAVKKQACVLVARIVDYNIARALGPLADAISAGLVTSTSAALVEAAERTLLSSAVEAPLNAEDAALLVRSHASEAGYARLLQMKPGRLEDPLTHPPFSARRALAAYSRRLRDDFSAAMHTPRIGSFAEGPELAWFPEGTFSRPPATTGSGHLRPRRPLPTERKKHTPARASPASRFEPDAQRYLGVWRPKRRRGKAVEGGPELGASGAGAAESFDVDLDALPLSSSPFSTSTVNLVFLPKESFRFVSSPAALDADLAKARAWVDKYGEPKGATAVAGAKGKEGGHADSGTASISSSGAVEGDAEDMGVDVGALNGILGTPNASWLLRAPRGLGTATLVRQGYGCVCEAGVRHMKPMQSWLHIRRPKQNPRGAKKESAPKVTLHCEADAGHEAKAGRVDWRTARMLGRVVFGALGTSGSSGRGKLASFPASESLAKRASRRDSNAATIPVSAAVASL